MAADIGIRIGVEGENTFKTALSGINAQLKQLNSEMKATVSSMDRMGDEEATAAKKSDILARSIEASKQKISILSQQYEKAEDKLRELGTALEQASQEFGENSAEAIQAQNAYNRQAAAVAKLGTQLNNAVADMNRMEAELEDISSEAKQAENALEDLGNEADGIGGKFSGGFSAAKVAIGNLISDGIQMAIEGIKNLASEAMQTADSLTKFEGTMEFAGFDQAEIEASKKAVQDYASQTVYDLGEVANTTAQLAANGVKDYQKLTEAAGNLNAVAGGNADTFGSVAMVMTQTAGAGKLTTENWNQLADAIPGASGEIQKALLEAGAYTGNFREAMEKGEISAEEFNAAIMNLGMSEAAIEAASSVATIEGAVGNLKATLVDGFVKVLTDGGLMEGITGFINGFTNILSGAGQYIGPAIQSIKDSISSIGEAFTRAFGDERAGKIMDFLSRLASALVGVPFQIVATAVDVVATAFELLITAIGKVVDFFSGTLPGALETVGGFFTGIGDGFRSLKEFMSADMESIKSDLSSGWQNLKDNVSKSAENLNTNASKSLESLRSAASEKSEKSRKAATEAFEKIKTEVTSKVDQAKTAVSNGFQTILTTISGKLNDAFGQAKGILSNILAALVSWGSNMVSQAKSAMSNVVSNIASTLRGAISQMTSIGGQIVQGLANGIRNGVSSVVNAAASVVSSAIAAAKSKLGIRSPSRVFMGIGDQTVAGLTLGLEKNTKYAAAAAAETATAVTDAFSANLQGITAPVPSMAAQVNAGFAQTTGSMLTSLLGAIQNGGSGGRITLEVPLYINGKEFYRATIGDLTTALNNYSRATGMAY